MSRLPILLGIFCLCFTGLLLADDSKEIEQCIRDIKKGYIAEKQYSGDVQLKAFKQILKNTRKVIKPEARVKKERIDALLKAQNIVLSDSLEGKKLAQAEKLLDETFLKLGADKFETRQKAEDTLKDGVIFIDELKKKLSNEKDPEVLVRGRSILKYWQEKLVKLAEIKKEQNKNPQIPKDVWKQYYKERKATYQPLFFYWDSLRPGYAKTKAGIALIIYLNESDGYFQESYDWSRLFMRCFIDNLTHKQKMECISLLAENEKDKHYFSKSWSFINKLTKEDLKSKEIQKLFIEKLKSLSSPDSYFDFLKNLPEDFNPDFLLSKYKEDPDNIQLALLLLKFGYKEALPRYLKILKVSSNDKVNMKFGGGGYTSTLERAYFTRKFLLKPKLQPYMDQIIPALFIGLEDAEFKILYDFLEILKELNDNQKFQKILNPHLKALVGKTTTINQAMILELLLQQNDYSEFNKLIDNLQVIKHPENDDNREQMLDYLDQTLIRIVHAEVDKLNKNEFSVNELQTRKSNIMKIFKLAKHGNSEEEFFKILVNSLQANGIFPDVREDIFRRCKYTDKKSWDYPENLMFQALINDAKHRGDLKEFIRKYANDVLKTGNGDIDVAGILFNGYGKKEDIAKLFKNRLKSNPKNLPDYVRLSIMQVNPEMLFSNAKYIEENNQSSALSLFDTSLSDVNFKPVYDSLLPIYQAYQQVAIGTDIAVSPKHFKTGKSDYISKGNIIAIAALATIKEKDTGKKLIKYLYDQRDPGTSYSSDPVTTEILVALYFLGTNPEEIKDLFYSADRYKYCAGVLEWLKGNQEKASEYWKTLSYKASFKYKKNSLMNCEVLKFINQANQGKKVTDEQIRTVNSMNDFRGKLIVHLINVGRYDLAIKIKPEESGIYGYKNHFRLKQAWLHAFHENYEKARLSCKFKKGDDQEVSLYAKMLFKLFDKKNGPELKQYFAAVNNWNHGNREAVADKLKQLLPQISNSELKAMMLYQIGGILKGMKKDKEADQAWAEASKIESYFGRVCKDFGKILPDDECSSTVTGSYYSSTPLPQVLHPYWPQFGITKKRGKPYRKILECVFRDKFGMPFVNNKNCGYIMGGRGWWMILFDSLPMVDSGNWTFLLKHEKGSELHSRVLLPMGWKKGK